MGQTDPLPQGTTSRVVLFLVADLVQRGLGLVLLALLLVRLPADAFARYGLFTTAMTLGYMLLTVTLPSAPLRLYFDCTTDRERAALVTTVVLASLGLLLGLGAVVVAVAHGFGLDDALTGGSLPVQLLLLAAILGFASFQFVSTLLRVLGAARRFLLVAVAYSILQLALFVVFLHTGSDGFLAILWATVTALLTASLIGLEGLHPLLRRVPPSRAVLRAALHFCGPQMVHGVSLWAVNASGAWIGTRYLTLEEIAPFALLNILFSVVNGVTTTLYQARIPELGRAFAGGRVEEANRLLWRTCGQALGVVMVGYVVGTLLLHARLLPLPAQYVLPLDLLSCGLVANLMHAWYFRGYNYLSFSKQTGRQALGTCLAGALTVLVTFPLAAHFGTFGLALALAVGTFFQATATSLFTYTLSPAPHRTPS